MSFRTQLHRMMAASILLGLLNSSPAVGQGIDAFPNKPMKLIIPFAPGGGTDIVGRTVALKLQEAWGFPVIADNQAGASGLIGINLGMKASPDGHTMTFVTAGIAVNPQINPDLRYDLLRDFAALSQLTSQPLVLVVNPSFQARTVKEIIALAKASPGTLNYGSSGVGGTAHLASELFASLAGIKMTHVPYKGGNPAMQDVVAGNTQMIFSSIAQAQSLLKAGRLRSIAVTTSRRAAVLPDLPTIAEAGVPGYEVAGWWGLVLPNKVPESSITKLNRELARIVHLPDVAEKFAADGSQAVGGTAEEFRVLIKTEITKWGKIVKEAGIKGS